MVSKTSFLSNVLATDKNAAPNIIPVKSLLKEKIWIFVIASTLSDGEKYPNAKRGNDTR
jgi:hypothetical protein